MNYKINFGTFLAIVAGAFVLNLVPNLSIVARADVPNRSDKLLLAQACKDQEIRDSGSSTGRTWYVCDYQLSFQSDGNLVLSKRGISSQVLWASGTDGRGYKLSIQSDGNVAIYDRANSPIWATNTSGNPGAFLALQNDGNLVVYTQNRRPIFATNTSGGASTASNNNPFDWNTAFGTIFSSNSNNTNSASNCVEQAKKANLFDRDAKHVCTNATPYVGECVQQAKKANLFDRDAIDVCRNATAYVGQCIQQTKQANFFDRDAISVCRNASVQTIQCIDSGRKANKFSSQIIDTCRNYSNSIGQSAGQTFR